METRKIVWAAILVGIAAGVMLTPSGRKRSMRGEKNFSGKLNKELKKFDSAMKKQLKTARKEISQLVEDQFHKASH